MDKVTALYLKVRNVLKDEAGESGCLGLLILILCFAIAILVVVGGGSSDTFMDAWDATSFK